MKQGTSTKPGQQLMNSSNKSRITTSERTVATATGGLKYNSLAKAAVVKTQNLFSSRELRFPNLCNVSAQGNNQIKSAYCDKKKKIALLADSWSQKRFQVEPLWAQPKTSIRHHR